MRRVATESPASVSGWAPLRRPVFRALWLAQFVANTGAGITATTAAGRTTPPLRDVSEPSLYVETFTVATWHEHLRQHLERGTVWDRELEAAARALTMDGTEPVVRHLAWADALRPSPDE